VADGSSIEWTQATQPPGGHRTRPSGRGVRNPDSIPDGHNRSVRQDVRQSRLLFRHEPPMTVPDRTPTMLP
jgi:hypothetical protein